MIEVRGHGVHASLGAHPVTRGEYKAFVRATGRSTSGHPGAVESPSEPVTCVSQVDAIAYGRWLGPQEGCIYRLPSLAELSELANEAAMEGISPEIWPHHHDYRPELRGGFKPVHLCEWTLETETIPRPDGQSRVLGSVFYPPWLREGPNASHQQACLLASEGYSFVTFRLARAL
jgi:hypothetical protein